MNPPQLATPNPARSGGDVLVGLSESELGTIWVMSPPCILSPEKSRVSPNGSSNSSFCRICHEGDGLEVLVSPCKCTGTLALIHASCLEHWLTSSNTDKCEICKHEFTTTREPRSYAEYIQDSSNSFNVRNLVADVVCFFLLTPLLIVSTYLCTLGAQQYLVRERWEAIGLIILAVFLLSVYYTWCHVTLRYHVGVWKSWKETNQRVRLVEVISCAHHELPPVSSNVSHHQDSTPMTFVRNGLGLRRDESITEEDRRGSSINLIS